jgi:hypothetical protein
VETISVIKDLAANNRLWGAERIRGERLTLGINAAKRTIQRYMRQARPSRPPGQTWATFLRVTDIFFRPFFASLITQLDSRRVVRVGVTRSPRDAWVTQQRRAATSFGEAPMYLIRDNDAKYGQHLEAVAAGSRIEVLRTGRPQGEGTPAIAMCERLLGTVRRERLDHLLILNEQHLSRVLTKDVTYFNQARTHQGIQ